MPAEFVARDKARTIAGIRESLTKPESIASKAFWRLAYGDHPYGVEATVESIEAITREDLLSFHAKHYVANRAVVAMIGDITREEAQAIALELTRRLPQGEPLPEMPSVAKPVGSEQRIPHAATQAHILIGTPALARSDPDFFALTVGNYILGGGGFVSRLTREVREARPGLQCLQLLQCDGAARTVSSGFADPQGSIGRSTQSRARYDCNVFA